MPGTTWPVNGHPPGSSRDYPPAPVSMPANLFRHVNGYNARLPDPRLTHEPGLLPHRSPRQSSANAAVGGLKPPPAGRLRRANNPSSPAQHRLKKLAYHAPLNVRDTRGSRLRAAEYPRPDYVLLHISDTHLIGGDGSLYGACMPTAGWASCSPSGGAISRHRYDRKTYIG